MQQNYCVATGNQPASDLRVCGGFRARGVKKLHLNFQHQCTQYFSGSQEIFFKSLILSNPFKSRMHSKNQGRIHRAPGAVRPRPRGKFALHPFIFCTTDRSTIVLCEHVNFFKVEVNPRGLPPPQLFRPWSLPWAQPKWKIWGTANFNLDLSHAAPASQVKSLKLAFVKHRKSGRDVSLHNPIDSQCIRERDVCWFLNIFIRKKTQSYAHVVSCSCVTRTLHKQIFKGFLKVQTSNRRFDSN